MLVVLFFSLIGLFTDVVCLEPVKSSGSAVLFDAEQILISEDIILIDEVAHNITLANRIYFSNKTELHDVFDCKVKFDDLAYALVGYVQHISFDGINTTASIVYFNNALPINLITESTRWTTAFCDPEHTVQVLRPAQFDTISEPYIKTIDISGAIIDYQPARFDTIIEQHLVKEGFSALQEVVPAQFETVTELVLLEESDVCRNDHTEYELVTEQVLEKDFHIELEGIPATFQNNSELVLAKDGYIEYEFADPILTSDTFQLLEQTDYLELQKSWLADCEGFGLDCIEWQPFTDSLAKKVYLYDKITCPIDFEYNKWCQKRNVFPDSVISRSWQTLSQTLEVEQNQIAAQYGTRQYTHIKNKNEIPDSCIEYQYEKRQFQKLVQPATILTEEVPAVFETRSYIRRSSQSTFSVSVPKTKDTVQHITARDAGLTQSTIVPPSIISEIKRNEISDSLAERGFAGDNFHENIFDFSCQENLSFGYLTNEHMRRLGITIDPLSNDTVLDTIAEVWLDSPLFIKNQSEVLRIQQTVLDKNCQVGIYDLILLTQGGPGLDLHRLLINGNSNGALISNYDYSKIFYKKLGDSITHTIVDMSLDHCDEVFTITHQGAPFDIPIREVKEDEDGRKVIVFDILLAKCSGEPEQFKFIEGLGTNAGLYYEVIDGQVTTQLKCHLKNDGVIFSAENIPNCFSALSTEFHQEENIVLYPNPAHAYLKIAEGWNVNRITSLLGDDCPLEYSAKGQINISNLPAGIYFAHVSETNGISIFVKFVKQ